MTFVLIAVAIAAALGLYFAFGRGAAQLPASKDKDEPRLDKHGAAKAPPLPPSKPTDARAIPKPPKPGEALQSYPPPAPPPVAPASRRTSKADVAGLKKGLAATRGGFMARLTALFTGKKEIDPSILEEIEEVLLTSDVGVKTTATILERLRDGLAKNELNDSDAVWRALRAEASRILTASEAGGGGLRLDQKPTVVLMVGVNGVGKTTTIGKLATKLKAEKKNVMLAAGDTFRAAAVQQLQVWGERTESPVIRGKDGSDPGAVAFDATSKAVTEKCDVLFVDTAGRLHTKAP
ncbi:MAG: signal recognition particle receptor subunit alpha, partial [Polyangiaceae bacterium]